MPTIIPPKPTIIFDEVPIPPTTVDFADFGTDMYFAAMEHPQTEAMRRHAAEQAQQPPFEQSDVYKQHVAFFQDALQRVPESVRKQYADARQRFDDIDSALTSIDTELATIRANRPNELKKLDTWATQHGTASAKRETLLMMHQQAADQVAAARTAVIDALLVEVSQQRQEAAIACEAAAAAERDAKRVLSERHAAERQISRYATRLRDERDDNAYVRAALKGL